MPLSETIPIAQIVRPAPGWLRAVRDAQDLTLWEVAQRLKVTPPAVRSFEKAEAEDRITLASLRRIAAAMDCELVYALVPKPGAVIVSSQSSAVSESVSRDAGTSEKVTDLTWHAQRGEL